jgi:hypothetical protein
LRKIAGLVGLVLLAGCRKPASEPVSVDLNAILRKEPAAKLLTVDIPKPPGPQQGISVVQEGRPQVVLNDPAAGRAAEVRQMLRAQQEVERERLETRLRDFYRGAARQFQLEQERTQSEAERRQYERANDLIREEFERLAAERAPLLARLAVLAGFPDPNPRSVPPETPLGNVSQQRFDEAKKLREELRRLDASFDELVETILGAVEDVSALDRAATRVKIELYKAELDRRAEREAREEVQQAVRTLQLRLADSAKIVLPAVPERRVELAAQKPLSPAPLVRSEGVLQGKADRRQLLEHQLRIWLGLNRYALADRGRDVTEDFQRWRTANRAGL